MCDSICVTPICWGVQYSGYEAMGASHNPPHSDPVLVCPAGDRGAEAAAGWGCSSGRSRAGNISCKMGGSLVYKVNYPLMAGN
jgi:hypothetical protein